MLHIVTLVLALAASPDTLDPPLELVPAVIRNDETTPIDANAILARPPRERSVLARAALTPAIPSNWSFGIGFPVTRVGFQQRADGSYAADVVPVQAAIGTSVFYHAVRGAGDSVPVGIGALLFGASDLSSKQSDAGIGIAVGPSFFDNHVALLVGCDLYRKIGDRDRGLLMAGAGGKSGFGRESVYFLINFGIGLGKDAPGTLKIAP